MAVRRQSALGAALRGARAASGLTQAALAAQAGIARATIIQLEAGRGRLSTLATCAATLGLAPVVGGRETDGKSIGATLADRRRELGLAPNQAVPLTKIRAQAIADIEGDGDMVLVATAERLAESLGCRLTLAPAANPYASQSATEES